MNELNFDLPQITNLEPQTECKDVDIIAEIRKVIDKRKYIPSRKLWQQAELILKKKYAVTDKAADNKIKEAIKMVKTVQLTCSTRFKVKLDIIEFILGD